MSFNRPSKNLEKVGEKMSRKCLISIRPAVFMIYVKAIYGAKIARCRSYRISFLPMPAIRLPGG
jgi:hypothetical protein